MKHFVCQNIHIVSICFCKYSNVLCPPFFFYPPSSLVLLSPLTPLEGAGAKYGTIKYGKGPVVSNISYVLIFLSKSNALSLLHPGPPQSTHTFGEGKSKQQNME